MAAGTRAEPTPPLDGISNRGCGVSAGAAAERSRNEPRSTLRVPRARGEPGPAQHEREPEQRPDGHKLVSQCHAVEDGEPGCQVRDDGGARRPDLGNQGEVEEERSSGLQLVGIGTGIAGVTLLLGIDVGTGGLELVGALLVLLASLAYAVGALALKRRLGGAQPVAMAAGAVSAGAAYLLVPALATFPTAAPSVAATASLIALGVGGTGSPSSSTSR